METINKPLPLYAPLSIEGRIFRKLLTGVPMTVMTACCAGETSDGGRYLRYIRQDGHPLKHLSEKSKNGGIFYRYYFDKEYIQEVQERMRKEQIQ